MLPTYVLTKSIGVHLNCFALLILTFDICTYKQQQPKKPKNVLVNFEIHSNNAWNNPTSNLTLLQVYNTYNSSIYATMVIVSPTKEIPSPIYVIYVKAFWCFSGSWKGRQEEKKDIKFASKIISEHRNPFYFIGLAF